jgi:protein tyrosine phosphatase (PTP) superfamily phosphohydrolase (DUF442 family)
VTEAYPPGVKPFEYDRITERLLAGRNPLNTADVERLQAEGVTHILDLREPHEWQPPYIGQAALSAAESCGITRRHLPIRDTGTPQPKDFEAAVAFLTEMLLSPDTQVYVHCRAGMERTAVILIAYFARQWEADCAETLRRLQRARPKFQPLAWQYEAVEAWLKRHTI